MDTILTNGEFEEIILQAVAALPDDIRHKMENVEIILEDEEVPNPHLLGLYQGIPQTRRGIYYSWVLPDKITIYKKTIERYARNKDHLEKLIGDVVRHEIAHHFGYSDEELDKKKSF